jgi:LemA protein
MTATVSTQVVVLVAMLLAAALALWTILAFNRLVRERNLMQEGWSAIDVQLKRRHNLVPNLVEAVKAYSRHEKDLLEGLAALRARAAGDDVRAAADRENALTDQLKSLFALAEDYPELRADRSYRQLMTQLSEIEDQIQYARRYYNGAARNYNIRVASFPSNLVAGGFGFRRAEFFQIATATERAAPEVAM